MGNPEQTSLLLNTLRSTLLDDLFKDFNQVRKRWIRELLEPLIWISVQRFANLAVNFDLTVSSYGFQRALQELVAHFVNGVSVSGLENVPQDGPLLIISNHPGTIDSIAIGASLPRDDLRILATGFPLLRGLPAASRHLVFVDPHASLNIAAVRSTIQHLRESGTVLLFPSGRIEPDPSIRPDARQALQKWSPSIELFLRKEPRTRVMITIVSGVLLPIFLYNPLIRLWKGLRDPLAIAEVTQIATQMILKGSFRTTPRISFDYPQTVSELCSDQTSISQAVINKAGRLMNDHLTMSFQLKRAAYG